MLNHYVVYLKLICCIPETNILYTNYNKNFFKKCFKCLNILKCHFITLMVVVYILLNVFCISN